MNVVFLFYVMNGVCGLCGFSMRRIMCVRNASLNAEEKKEILAQLESLECARKSRQIDIENVYTNANQSDWRKRILMALLTLLLHWKQ